MKVLISTEGSSYSNSLAIAFPIELAAAAASLVANGVPVSSDGYGESQRWARKKDVLLTLSFVEDEKMADITPREERLKKEAEQASSERWKKHNEAEKLKKELEAALAQIELLKSVTVCTTTETPQAETYAPEEIED